MNKLAIISGNAHLGLAKDICKNLKVKLGDTSVDTFPEGEIQVKHVTTDEMWIDSNTKPTMGRRYRVDRSHIMGCPVDLPESLADVPM